MSTVTGYTKAGADSLLATKAPATQTINAQTGTRHEYERLDEINGSRLLPAELVAQ